MVFIQPNHIHLQHSTTRLFTSVTVVTMLFLVHLLEPAKRLVFGLGMPQSAHVRTNL